MQTFLCIWYGAGLAKDPQAEPGGETPAITDPHVLRVIAHPVRMRLYELLLTGGPATAAKLAEYVPAALGSLSYHLRQLASCGYVQEALELITDGRERKAVPGGVRWTSPDFLNSPGGRAAVDAAQRVLISRQLDRLRAWQEGGAQRWGPQWEAAAVSTDTILYLTAEELQQFAAELDEMVTRWAEHSRHHRARATNDPDREQVFVFTHAFPIDPSAEPTVSARPAG